jgi:hypothetical protein
LATRPELSLSGTFQAHIGTYRRIQSHIFTCPAFTGTFKALFGTYFHKAGTKAELIGPLQAPTFPVLAHIGTYWHL